LGKSPSKLGEFNEIEFAAVREYEPKPFAGRVALFSSISGQETDDGARAMGWHNLVVGGLEILRVPGGHGGIFAEPNVNVLAQTLGACLREAQATQH
jgi:thioesterase domain-containing protein